MAQSNLTGWFTKPADSNHNPKDETKHTNRDKAIKSEGLGVKITNDRGLAGLHEKRNRNLGQFFTPLPIAKLITDLLNIPADATVLDNTAGVGRLGYHLPNKELFTAIEVEEEAHSNLETAFPTSPVLRDDAINHITDLENRFDYVLINPPFSLNWIDKRNELINKGYKGSVLSHIACIEIGIRALKRDGIIAIIAPSNLWTLETSRVFHRWVRSQTTELMRIKLPHRNLFAATEWECSTYLLVKADLELNPIRFEFHKTFDESFESDRKTLIDKLESSDILKKVIQSYSRSRCSLEPVQISKISKVNRKKQRTPYTFNLNRELEDTGSLNVTVSNVKDRLVIKTQSREASLRIAWVKTGYNPHAWDYSNKIYLDEWEHNLRLSRVWSKGVSLLDHPIIKDLRKQGLHITYDPQLINYISRKRRQFRIENTPLEHWIETDNGWTEYYKREGIKNTSLYKEYMKRFQKLGQKYGWISNLYEFQKEDVIRLALKRRAINATEQGLGKTRELIATALLKDCKRNLFIIPSHLTHNWREELNILGIKAHFITRERDVYRLSRFNIITYNTLRKPFKSIKSLKARKILEEKIREVNESHLKPKDKRDLKKHIRTFADVLKKRFKFIGFDEAHYLSNKTSLQTLSAYKLRSRHMLMMTGTPIGNTVKNIYSLLDILYKSGSPHFPYTTKEFREAFVTVEWVTPEFDDTLSSGRTAQQLANVKDPEKFKELMASKWIRRLKDEPEVQKDIKIPKPELKEIMITPDKAHTEFYNYHLENFAEIFKQYLHPEDEEHKIDTSIILALLQNLQFVSTIPQHDKCNLVEKYNDSNGLTCLQAKIINLIRENRDRRIILFTQRPDLCSLLSAELRRKGIRNVLFTGKMDLDKRNRNLTDFKYNGVKVMLASINVTDTGLNIPQANMAIMADPDWKYSKLEQAFSRILRPQTKGNPRVYFLRNKGFIDDYMWQHCMNKKTSNAEVIDFRENDFKGWTHWKDFTIKMLQDKGMM